MKHRLKFPVIPGLLLLAVLLLAAGTLGGTCIIPVREWWEGGSLNPVLQLRLVRTGAALVIGGALALSGLTFQAVLRNPLAEPFTLGISGGAGVGVALSFLSGLHLLNRWATPLAALAGALLTLGIVLKLSRRSGHGPETLLLSGVITGTIAGSLLTFLLSIAGTNELAGITWWLLGDLQNVEPAQLLSGGIVLAAGTLLLCRLAGTLDALATGESEAWNLGVDVPKTTRLAILIASMLAAQTVAMAGMIGFCGLIIPHAVRRVLGCSHRRIVLPALLSGAAFLTFCDLLSRVVAPEREIPVGVVTALIGGPFFLWLLTRRRAPWS